MVFLDAVCLIQKVDLLLGANCAVDLAMAFISACVKGAIRLRTSAPIIFAIWIAAMPTPPAADWIRID